MRGGDTALPKLLWDFLLLQRQQMLQQQLATVQQQPKLAGSDAEFEPLHLHHALDSIQHDVLQDNGAVDSARSVDQMQR